MKTENLEPITRMIVREVALGLPDEDVCVNHPEYKPFQIAKMRAGKTFKRALLEMQKQIDEEVIAHAAEDPVRQYMKSKGFPMAKRLVALAENVDGETPHAVQAKCADSVLAKAGYATVAEQVTVPILMLSPSKLAAVMERPDVLANVPDVVDGHVDDWTGSKKK